MIVYQFRIESFLTLCNSVLLGETLCNSYTDGYRYKVTQRIHKEPQRKNVNNNELPIQCGY